MVSLSPRKPEPNLFTCCPDCRTTFRVTPEVLAKADGQVRCGRCHAVFDAFIDLRDDEPGEAPPARPQVPESADEDTLKRTDTFPAPEFPEPALDPAAAAVSAQNAGAPSAALVSPESAESVGALEQALDWPPQEIGAMSLLDVIEDIERPGELVPDAAPGAATPDSEEGPDAGGSSEQDARDASASPGSESVISPAQVDAVLAPHDEPGPHPPATAVAWPEPIESAQAAMRATRVWAGVSAAALLLLSLQAVHHFRHELASQPGLGPALIAAYNQLGAPVRATLDLAQYEIVDWVAAAEPVTNGQNTLRITARIRNRSERAAPFPDVRLALTDRWEATVGSRIFHPPEYLPEDLAREKLLAAGSTVPAVLAVLDPGPDAYGFELDICAQSDSGAHRCATDRVFQ